MDKGEMMPFFYERKETKHTTRIRCRNQLLYSLAFLVLIVAAVVSMALAILAPDLFLITFPAVFILLFALHTSMSGVSRELHEAMAEGRVKISGSRWSEEEPLTYVIKKRPAAQE
jgi:hypothetical protein